MRITIIGDSALSFFTALGLESDLARHVQNDVTYISRDKTLFYQPDMAVFQQRNTISKSKAFSHVELSNAQVKSINLRERRVVTDKAVIDFDILIVDQTPCYTESQIRAVEAALKKLIIQAKSHPLPGAAVRLKGESAAVWQFALALKSWLHKGRYNVGVEVVCSDPSVKSFLKDNGVATEFSKLPGFTVEKPETVVSNKKIKGITLDQQGGAITDHEGTLKGHGNVMIFDDKNRMQRNIYRADRNSANLLVEKIDKFTQGKLFSSIELMAPALLLHGIDGSFSRVGRAESRRLRSAAVSRLDRSFWTRLANSYR